MLWVLGGVLILTCLTGAVLLVRRYAYRGYTGSTALAWWLFGVPPALAFLGFYVWAGHVLLVVALLLAAGIAAWLALRNKRLLRDDPGPAVCAQCGYERPEDRVGAAEVCPECGNAWWDRFHDTISAPVASGAMPRRLYRQRKRVGLVQVVTFCCILPGLMTLNSCGGAVASRLPNSVVIFAALHAWGSTGNDALQEAMSRPNLTSSQAEALFERVIELRDERLELPSGTNPGVESLITGGLLTADLLDRFYAPSLEWTLSAVITEDGSAVEPRLHLRELGNTIYFDPAVIRGGVRINGGAFEQRMQGVTRADWIAYSFEDYFIVRMGGRPTHRRDSPAGAMNYKGFAPVPIGALPPGTHTLTVRVHMYVLPRSVNPRGHAFLEPGGAITPHPQAIWSETRDVSTTFTVP